MRKNVAKHFGVSLASLILFCTFFISFPTYADDSVVDVITINVPTSCSLEGTGMNTHNATMQNNDYQPNIGTTTLKASCNDPSGFAIYAVGYTNDTIGLTYLDSSVDSAYDIVTGTATSGSTSNWAMKLATVTSSTPAYPITIDNSFNNYQAVPSTFTKVAHRDSSTDVGTNAIGSTLTTTYAAFVNSTQPAGTYTGKVRYTLVHPASETPTQPVACTGGKICYNANASTVTGQMGRQTAGNNASVTLYASNFKRDGYGFAGWNTAYDYSGTFYGPNQDITTPADTSTNGLSLYAVWVPSAGDMQNWSGCSGLAKGSVTALTDNRDNNTYAVAKLADNKCWVIENLRLADKDSNNNDINLSSTNTHNPSLPLTNIYDATNPTTSNHLSATINPTTTAWCRVKSSTCIDQSMLTTNNTTLFANNTSSNYSASSNVYSYGNYYNWYSATAGHGKYGSSYSSGYIAPGDICPAGWHLPKSGDKSQESTNEFWQLIVNGLNNGVNPANYDSSLYPFYIDTEATLVSGALRSFPNNFVLSGHVDGPYVDARNSGGGYWSSSAFDNSDMFYLNFSSTYLVFPGTITSSKYWGWVVRCIAGV